MIKFETIYDSGWVANYKPAENKSSSKLLIMLHGWTGDENSMGVFIKGLNSDFHIIAPRAPFDAIPSGYSWINPVRDGEFPDWSMFLPTASRFMEQINSWLNLISIATMTKPILLGFSQGAAMALVLGISYPTNFSRVAAISGFLPKGYVISSSPSFLPDFYIAHGTNDTIVPVENSWQTVSYLNQLGANVIYCESDAKHRMSLKCLPGLMAFLQPS